MLHSQRVNRSKHQRTYYAAAAVTTHAPGPAHGVMHTKSCLLFERARRLELLKRCSRARMPYHSCAIQTGQWPPDTTLTVKVGLCLPSSAPTGLRPTGTILPCVSPAMSALHGSSRACCPLQHACKLELAFIPHDSKPSTSSTAQPHHHVFLSLS